MHNNNDFDGPPTWVERILGGILAFLLFGITTILTPLVLAGKAIGMSPFLGFYHVGVYGSVIFYIWVAFISVAACVYGLVFGLGKVIKVLSYLWFTAYPPNPELSRRYWASIVISGLVTWIGMLAARL